MGKKGGSSYHERPLSEEEKQLLRQQQAYLASIQPSIDQLVSRGTALLDDVVNPNWSSIYSQTVNDVDNLRKEQAELATGKLPDAYANAKTIISIVSMKIQWVSNCQLWLRKVL